MEFEKTFKLELFTLAKGNAWGSLNNNGKSVPDHP